MHQGQHIHHPFIQLPNHVPDLLSDLVLHLVHLHVHHLATLLCHMATQADQQNGNIKMCDLLTNLPTDHVGVGEMLTHGKNDSIVLVKNVCSGACSQHCSEFIRDPGEEGCW